MFRLKNQTCLSGKVPKRRAKNSWVQAAEEERLEEVQGGPPNSGDCSLGCGSNMFKLTLFDLWLCNEGDDRIASYCFALKGDLG